MSTLNTFWTALVPPFCEKNSALYLLTYARKLARAVSDLQEKANPGDLIEKIRHEFVGSIPNNLVVDRQMVVAAGLIITDLVIQGWALRVKRGVVEVKPPEAVLDPATDKERIRRQETVKRDAQLRQPAVKKFIRSMERIRRFDGRFVSIFSLMRDGRELAAALQEGRKHFDNGWANALSRVI